MKPKTNRGHINSWCSPENVQGLCVNKVCIGGSKGGARDATPLVSKFFDFHAVFGKNNRLAHPLWELAPRKILDPPLVCDRPCRYLIGFATSQIDLLTTFAFIHFGNNFTRMYVGTTATYACLFIYLTFQALTALPCVDDSFYMTWKI